LLFEDKIVAYPLKDELVLQWPNRFWAASHDRTIFILFFSNASRSKLRMSTKFMILGAMDQKLWVFEVFKKSLSRAGMCWSHMPTLPRSPAQKVEGRRKKKSKKKEIKPDRPGVDP
jgi:hypothetical protein